MQTIPGPTAVGQRRGVTTVQPRTNRPVLLWAGFGLAFNLLAAYMIGRWLLSGPTATPAGPTDPPAHMKVGVIMYQTIGCAAIIFCIWFWVIRPWRQQHRLTTDAMFLIVCGALVWQDPIINWSSSHFAYNGMYVNLGSWGPYLPGWIAPNQDRLAEPILGNTIYVWGVFTGIVLVNLIMRKAKARWPQMGNLGLVLVCFGAMMALDGLLEPFWMWFFGAWSYPGALKGLTLFEGTYYQFPIWEVFHWPFTWGTFALVRYFVDDRGQTFAERGIDGVRVSPKRKTAIRLLAISGMLNLLFFCTYNIPVGLFWGQNSSAWPKDIENRSYFRNGICGEGTTYHCPGPVIPAANTGSVHLDPEGRVVVPPRVDFPAGDRSKEGNLVPLRPAPRDGDR